MSAYAFHPQAVSDPDEVWEFIAQENLAAADALITELLAFCELLSRFPHLGRTRPELAPGFLRYAVMRDFLIAYAPDERPLWILAILHGRRNPRILAAILRDRV